MTTTTLYISAFFVAYLSTLLAVCWVIVGNKRYDRESTRKDKDFDQAISDSKKALEIAKELQSEQDRLKQNQLGYEELLTSFNNRMSARSDNRSKKLSTEETIAMELQKQANELNGSQKELDIEPANPKKKRTLVRR